MTPPKIIGRLEREEDDRDFYTDPVTGRQLWSVTTAFNGTLDKSLYLLPWAAKLAAEFCVDNLDFITETIQKINKPGAVDLIKGQAKLLRETKRDIGTYQHDVLEALILGDGASIPPIPEHLVGVEIEGERVDLDALSDGLLNFLTEHEFEPEMAEATVANPEFGYAGTLDLYGTMRRAKINGRTERGVRCIIDLKTGRYDDVEAQLAPYKRATEVWIDHLGNKAPMPETDMCFVLHLDRKYDRGYKLIEVDASDAQFDRFLAHLRAYQLDRATEKPKRKAFYPPLDDGTQPLPLIEDIEYPGGFGSAKLQAAGLKTLADLAAMTEVQVRQISGIGPKTMTAIAAVLAEYKLGFAKAEVA